VSYALPERYIRAPAEPVAERSLPLWQRVWQERTVDIAILGVALIVLTGILVFQDAIVRRRRLHFWLRLGFLCFTLLWLGWYAAAQLSVINVLTFAQALRTGFEWDTFLLEPLMFILWGYVAVALLFWGRGVFCGWLCPFGALQELLNAAARRLRVPQVQVPFALHERLWPIKYIVFLGLFAVSLNSVTLAFEGAEIEPFKTAITLRFMRYWPFAAYAAGLLAAGLFIERFFCRYLCPLGAALAIPARLRMFEWLKRRVQCGRECRICAARCPVQAIHPLGQINPNECIHCLNCQTLYYDATTCPPLVARAQRRQRSKPGSKPGGKPAGGVAAGTGDAH
jgi:polyferredoxin